MHRMGCALVVLTLGLAGCAPDAGRPTTVSEAPTARVLPRHCSGLGPVPEAGTGTVTFTKDGALYSTSPEGGRIRCLLSHAGQHLQMWGGEGDRVLFDGRRRITPAGSVGVAAGPRGPAKWSRPVGTAVLYLANGRVDKEPSEGGPVDDVTPPKSTGLTTIFDAVYHPAGTHIAIAGTDGFSPSIYLITNEGTDPQQLAAGESARRLDQLAFSHGGRILYFAADHGDGDYDLHSISLESGEKVGSVATVAEGRLKTIDTGAEPFTKIVVSEFSRTQLIAYTQNTCDGPGGAQVYAWSKATGKQRVSDGSATFNEPIGWLPDDRLVFMRHDDGCDSPGDLFVWESGNVAAPLVAGVDSAAVRSILPPAPAPPAAAQGVVA